MGMTEQGQGKSEIQGFLRCGGKSAVFGRDDVRLGDGSTGAASEVTKVVLTPDVKRTSIRYAL
jgi:hypothetical protein